MPTPVETILTSAGIPAEDVTKIISLQGEEAEKFDANPYLEKVKGNYKAQFENDVDFFNDLTVEKLSPNVKKKIEDHQFGRAANIVKQKFYRTLGLTDADAADLPDEIKEKIETFIPAITEKWAKTKAGDKQLQQDLIDARKELEKYGPDYEKGIAQKYETQSEQKIATAIFRANLIGELSRIPGLKISASDIAKTADEILSSKYAFERVGDFGVELRQKANPQMKVLKNGSSHELTLSEALLEIATERSWVEKEQEKQKGSGKVPIIPTHEGLKAVVPPHLQSTISSKIAAEK